MTPDIHFDNGQLDHDDVFEESCHAIRAAKLLSKSNSEALEKMLDFLSVYGRDDVVNTIETLSKVNQIKLVESAKEAVREQKRAGGEENFGFGEDNI